MTCIVAIKDNNKVYIGADSAAISDTSVSTRKDPKVFKNGKFLFRFSGSFRFGQLLRFAFKPPKHEKKDDFEYLCTDFVKKLQTTLEKNGLGGENKRSEREVEGSIIIAYKGNIYVMDSDFQIGIPVDNYASIGCGSDLALGSLHTTDSLLGVGDFKKLTPELRIKLALTAAATFSTGVLPPFIIEHS